MKERKDWGLIRSVKEVGKETEEEGYGEGEVGEWGDERFQ